MQYLVRTIAFLFHILEHFYPALFDLYFTKLAKVAKDSPHFHPATQNPFLTSLFQKYSALPVQAESTNFQNFHTNAILMITLPKKSTLKPLILPNTKVLNALKKA